MIERLRTSSRAQRGAALFLALALVVSGFVLGWRLAPDHEVETSIGRVAFSVAPSAGGEATAVIPVADWGFRADAFDSAFELRAELRSLDRGALASAADGDLSVLDATEEQLEGGARAAALIAFAWGLGTAIALVLVAALIWRALRPRWLLPVAGAVLALVATATSLLTARATFDVAAFEQPTYFANGAELQRILEVAENERIESPYGSTFGSILRSVSSVLATSGGPGGPARQLFLGSDLHANALVVQPLSETIGDAPLLLNGDFGQRGQAAEARLLAPRVAALGSDVVATSGNHDTGALMDALAAAGVRVLGDNETGALTVADVSGLRVAGFPDPLVWTGKGDPRSRPITFDDLEDPEAAFDEALAEIVGGFDRLAPPPDVVMVHQNALAQALAGELLNRGYGRHLVIVTGHDHRQHINRYGDVIVVDGGSIGAGGIFDAGSEAIGLAGLHFDPERPRLRSVDLIAIEPFSGQAQASRVVIDALCPESERCTFEPPGLDESVLDEARERRDD